MDAGTTRTYSGSPGEFRGMNTSSRMKRLSVAWMCWVIIGAAVSGCADQQKPILTLADAHHASIGAMTGTTGEQLVRTRFPQATVKSFDDVMDAVAALKSNQLDAVITGYPAAMNVCKRNPDLTYLDEAVDYENTAIAVRKDESELLASLNKAIAEFTADGTLQQMRRRWFKMDLTPYEEVDIPQPKEGPVLKVGTSATREPFCYLDAQQRVTGHDGELARRIGAKLGRPIQFIDMKFSALITALQSGKVDLIVAGMTDTEERRRSVDFTQPYFQNSQRLIVRKVAGHETEAGGQARKLRSQDDLRNARIGVLLGSVHDTWAMSHYPNATILQYKSPSELILAVRSGKIDAAIYTHETLLEILRADDQLTLLGDTLFSVPIGMGFNKGNAALRLKFNEFFKKIRDEATYGDMVRRWIIDGETTMPRIPNPRTNGTLVVGYVSDKGLPFAVIKDNQVIGFDIEFAERFAAYLGKESKLADMEFGSLIAAAATNKIDMISSTLMITEQRKQQIDFSDEYKRLGASVFTLKANITAGQPTTFKTLNDVATKTVGVYAGSIQDVFVGKVYPNATRKTFNAWADMILALKMKKVDAVFMDLCAANVVMKSIAEVAILTKKP